MCRAAALRVTQPEGRGTLRALSGAPRTPRRRPGRVPGTRGGTSELRSASGAPLRSRGGRGGPRPRRRALPPLPAAAPPRPGASRLRAAICRCRLRPLPARPRPRGAFKRGEGRRGAARGPQRRRHGECGPAPPPVPAPVPPPQELPTVPRCRPPAPPRGRSALSSGCGAPRPSAAPDSRGIRRASPRALRRAPLPSPGVDGAPAAAERPGRGKGPRRCRAPGRGPHPPGLSPPASPSLRAGGARSRC